MRLREQAEARLQNGVAPSTKASVLSLDASALLHQMAGDPNTASQALKFLHELQVHQVELDLQHEELEHGQQEMSHALLQYVERFDLLPVVVLVVELSGRIIEGNRAAADLAGVEQAALGGRRIDALLTPQSSPVMAALLQRLRDGAVKASADIVFDAVADTARAFQVRASLTPTDRSVLMVLLETSDRPGSASGAAHTAT